MRYEQENPKPIEMFNEWELWNTKTMLPKDFTFIEVSIEKGTGYFVLTIGLLGIVYRFTKIKE